MLSGDETRSIIGAKLSIAGLLEVYMQNWSALFPSPAPKGTGEGKEKGQGNLSVQSAVP